MGTTAEPDLTAILERCAAAWPGVKVSPEAFAAHVAAVQPDASTPLSEALASLHAEDLYLACACALGDRRAIAAFEETYRGEVPGYVAQIDREPAFVDEVRQLMREKIFVAAEGERPKICEYSGRGPLGAWLRVVAVRIALNLRRRPKEMVQADGDDGPALPSPTLDPEIDFLKSRYREDFRAAFQATLASLSSDERTVMKMHYVDGLNIEQIGTAYRVHRSTIARWLASSREKIVDETKARLTARLHLAGSEAESIIGLVRSQLDVSICAFLGKKDEP